LLQFSAEIELNKRKLYLCLSIGALAVVHAVMVSWCVGFCRGLLVTCISSAATGYSSCELGSIDSHKHSIAYDNPCCPLSIPELVTADLQSHILNSHARVSLVGRLAMCCASSAPHHLSCEHAAGQLHQPASHQSVEFFKESLQSNRCPLLWPLQRGFGLPNHDTIQWRSNRLAQGLLEAMEFPGQEAS
jgi:hypothetical protein